MLVKVDNFVYPVDFVVLDISPSSSTTSAPQTPIILGRPFLATSNAIIHCRNGLLKMSFGNMTLELNIFNVGSQVGDDDTVNEVNLIDTLVEEHSDSLLSKDPLELCLTSDEISFLESDEVNLMSSLLDECEILEEISEVDTLYGVERYRQKFETLPPSEVVILPSCEQPPIMDLKELPSHLKYAYLGEKDTYSVVISSLLESNQESQLLDVLKSRRSALGWTIADLHGISPLICTHRIFLEDNVAPTR